MKWLFERYVRPSAKNGDITITRDFGRWQVSAKDCGQTTAYTHAMWIHAYKRLKKKFNLDHIQKILMLGLGAGGEIKLLYKTFPGCDLTVVEYDPAMIELTHELQLYKPYSAPHILVGDAAQVVPHLVESFDLIIVDLFNGPEPSPLSTDEAFVRSLAKRLHKNGIMLCNVYKRIEYLETPRKFFDYAEQWRFRLNHLGAFSNSLL
jgi:spermidine synthase